MGLRNDATLGQPLATSGSAIGGRGREWLAGHCNHGIPRTRDERGDRVRWLSAYWNSHDFE
jgi:hypothetical protein